MKGWATGQVPEVRTRPLRALLGVAGVVVLSAVALALFGLGGVLGFRLGTVLIPRNGNFEELGVLMTPPFFLVGVLTGLVVAAGTAGLFVLCVLGLFHAVSRRLQRRGARQ